MKNICLINLYLTEFLLIWFRRSFFKIKFVSNVSKQILHAKLLSQVWISKCCFASIFWENICRQVSQMKGFVMNHCEQANDFYKHTGDRKHYKFTFWSFSPIWVGNCSFKLRLETKRGFLDEFCIQKDLYHYKLANVALN